MQLNFMESVLGGGAGGGSIVKFKFKLAEQAQRAKPLTYSIDVEICYKICWTMCRAPSGSKVIALLSQ